MYVDVEHNTLGEVHPHVTFAYSRAIHETTQMTLLKGVRKRADNDNRCHAPAHTRRRRIRRRSGYLQHAQDARTLARGGTTDKQRLTRHVTTSDAETTFPHSRLLVFDQ